MGDCVMRIPLWSGGEIAAHALVDASDYDFLGQWRWQLRGGYARRTGYVEGAKRKFCTVFMHREVLGLVLGDGRVTDHISRDSLDNRRANLRVGSQGQNLQNTGSRPGSSSRYRGVSWHKAARKWTAKQRVGKREYYLGLFEDEDEAGKAAADFRREHLPFSAEAKS